MTQPKYAPILLEDEVRPTRRLGPAPTWVPRRPAELVQERPGVFERPLAGRGSPGPDQGYALRLAERVAGRLVLEEGEQLDDVLAGGLALAMRRAALFGRAPVAGDLEVAFGLFGFFGRAPEALVAMRKERFFGVSHDEWRRRRLANDVSEDDLRRSPSDASARPLSPEQLTSAP
jgi:hypothetical protein